MLELFIKKQGPVNQYFHKVNFFVMMQGNILSEI